MTKIVWDEVGKRYYETGVSQGVLYTQDTSGKYSKGVAWNGLITVNESPSGAEPTPLYADDIKYLNLMSTEEFGASIEAYTYPEEFALCDGTQELAKGITVGQQIRKSFGLSYKTKIGNDVDGVDHGYKLHLIYGALASPSQKSYSTINDNPDAITFSWDVKTTPVAVTGMNPTSTIIIDSTKVEKANLEALEKVLFGADDEEEPRLPLPDEILQLVGGSQA